MSTPRFAAAPLFLALALLAGPTLADPAEDRARFPRLTSWIEETERLEQQLDAHYSYHNGPKTQQKAFEIGGVDWAQRYSGDWGRWLFTDWDVARKIHRNTRYNLKEILNKKKWGKPLPANHMAVLETRMQTLRQQHSTLTRLFTERVDLNVKKALELDQYNEQHQKYLLAVAINSATADYHKAMAEKARERAQQWGRRGGAVSKQIRDIGYGRPAPEPAPVAEPEAEADGPVILTQPGVGLRSILIR